jgi:sulfite reductase subunit B
MNPLTVSGSAPVSPYLPRVARVADVRKFTDKEKYLRFRMEDGEGLEYRAGQFLEVGVFGKGEAPISICSAPGKHDDVEMCIRNVGDVTAALHALKVGDAVGIRGPFGNGFDMNSVAGMDLLFVAGGLGLAPCRGFILAALNDRAKFGRVTILYGSRTPADLLFTEDLQQWAQRTDSEMMVTVDRPDKNWNGHSGVITLLFKKMQKLDPASTVAFIIGPPIMFKFAVLEALSRGLRKNHIYCSLERRMKCGMGKCGHCQIRNVYVCQDGPIFSYVEVMKLREGI